MVGWVGNIPTTFIQLSVAGSIYLKMFTAIDPATVELDIGSWYVTYPPTLPTHTELSRAGSLKQTYLVFAYYSLVTKWIHLLMCLFQLEAELR